MTGPPRRTGRPSRPGWLPADVAVAGWVAGWLLAGRAHRLPAPAPERATVPAPTVSVIIPARNEAANLTGLLPLLRDEADEVIVVDDESSDGTAGVAEAHGATVLASRPAPGATGKTRACWQGARQAQGQILVFLDADVRPAPGFVRRLASAVAATGGLVSVQATHVTPTAVEALSATCSTIMHLAGTGPGTSARSLWRRPVAHGPALAVPAGPYRASGGHLAAGVAGATDDDMALARLMAANGTPVTTYLSGGPGDVTIRMYPDGARAIWEGWTKDMAAGAAGTAPLRTVLVGLWIAGGLTAAMQARRRPAGYLMYAAQHAMLFRRVGRFGASAAAAWPVPLTAFVAMFSVSAARQATGRPSRWRGREVRA